MTQPPPPPNQPPQHGGYGQPQGRPQQPAPPASPASPAPPVPPAQTPPAGGPDLAKSPQPAPGYGYPQAPPQHGAPQTSPPAGPPQPPSGYGYPGGQPNPYAQPPAGQPNPYAQPPAGQPNPYGAQQPGYGYPAQPPTVPLQPQTGQPGGGRKVNAQVAMIVSTVVVIALIIGTGIWYSHRSDGGKQDTANSSGGTGGKGDDGKPASGGTEKAPSDPASKVLYQVPMPEVSDLVTTSGSWLTGKAYVKTGVAEVVGYDRDKGTKLWTIGLPGPVCTASVHSTSDDRTAIVYEPAMPTKDQPTHGCSQVAAIDLDAGKKLWTQTVKSGDQLVRLDNVTVSGATVAVGGTNGGAAFDIADGKVLWAPKAADTCYDAGYGGGAKLVAVRKCGQYGQRQLHIQTIDPKSGKVISEYKMSQGIEYAAIVSTDPLVLAADVGRSAGDGSGISDFFSVDNGTGKLRAHISAPGDTYAARCDGISKVEDCRGLAVGNDRLYVPTEDHDGSEKYRKINEVVAFDLGTGKQTGQRADSGDGYHIYPLRMDGSDVIAYKSPPYDKGGQIVSIDGSSFKQTKLMENPSSRDVRDAETSMLPERAEFLYSQGHLYMSSVFARKSSSSFGKDYLALAFGTGG
ncbi:PQQ-binding-like beta-propeller repeat protein [Streptomyces sp. NPDC087787]|uniref:outer membrane protein assembly factor BamB family protein n=1 Tax=Streptomyces sp. NPDC087787 TaxID=3365803 RepID=UPI003807CC58